MELLRHLSFFHVLYNVGGALHCNLVSSLEIHEVVPAQAVLGALVISLDCAPPDRGGLLLGVTGSMGQEIGLDCELHFYQRPEYRHHSSMFSETEREMDRQKEKGREGRSEGEEGERKLTQLIFCPDINYYNLCGQAGSTPDLLLKRMCMPFFGIRKHPYMLKSKVTDLYVLVFVLITRSCLRPRVLLPKPVFPLKHILSFMFLQSLHRCSKNRESID